jgi:spore germination protein YaaH
MAKRKTPKVKDLRPEKLNEEQIKQVQQVISLSNKIKLELGNISVRQHTLLHEMDTVNKQISEINQNLEKEYGKIDVDISTGEIKYLDDEQANS